MIIHIFAIEYRIRIMQNEKNYEYKKAEVSDLLSDVNIPLFFDNGSTHKKKGAINVLSLFSGCGGMDLGLEGNFICHRKSVGLHSEWVEQSINSDWVLLKKNRFNTVFANDILKEAYLTWTHYMKRFDIESSTFHRESVVNLVKLHHQGVQVFPTDIDVVTGGFPCQDFSVAGKRCGFDSQMTHDGHKKGEADSNDETRGRLYDWMRQVIEITRPKIFIAENVKGLVSLGDVKNVIQRDFASAGNNGYYVFNPQVLHAGNYGVPETRERIIFIGVRIDALNEKTRDIILNHTLPEEYNPYPKPTHSYTCKDSSLPLPVVCRDVLEHLKEPDQSMDLSQIFYSKAKYMGVHCQGQSEINIDGLAPTIRSEHHGNIEFRRLSKEHGGALLDELSSGKDERRLTPRECALIQTFPPDYTFVRYKDYSKRFEVSGSGAYKVIGNAVPPMLAFNIAKRIEQIWDLYFN